MALLQETWRFLLKTHVSQERARLEARIEEMHSLILAEVEWKLSSFKKMLIDYDTKAACELSDPGYMSWAMTPEDQARLQRWQREEEEVRERRMQLRSEGIQAWSSQTVQMKPYDTEARLREQKAMREKALAEELKTIEQERRKIEEVRIEMEKKALEEERKNIEREKQKIEERKEMERQAKIQENQLKEKKKREFEAKQQEDAVRKKALEEEREHEKIDLEWKKVEAEKNLLETKKEQLLERRRKLKEKADTEKKVVMADKNRLKEEWEKIEKEKKRMEKERREYEALMKEMKKEKQSIERGRKQMMEEKILRGNKEREKKSDEVKQKMKITETVIIKEPEATKVAQGNSRKAESSDEFSYWDSDESDLDSWKPEAKSNSTKQELSEATVSAEDEGEDSPWDSDEEQAIPSGTKTAVAPNTQRANSPQKPADVRSVPVQNSAANKKTEALDDDDLFEEELRQLEKEQEAITSKSKPLVSSSIQKATVPVKLATGQLQQQKPFVASNIPKATVPVQRTNVCSVPIKGNTSVKKPSKALTDDDLFDLELEQLEKELEGNSSKTKPLSAPNNQKVTSIPTNKMSMGATQKATTPLKQANVSKVPDKKNSCLKTQSNTLTDPWSDEEFEKCDYRSNQTQKKNTMPAKKDEEDTDAIIRELERLNEELKEPKAATAPKKWDRPLTSTYTSTASSSYSQNDIKAFELRARERQNNLSPRRIQNDLSPKSVTGSSLTSLKAGGSNLAGLKGTGTQGQKSSGIEGLKPPAYLKYLNR